jgi:hypothetical protein
VPASIMSALTDCSSFTDKLLTHFATAGLRSLQWGAGANVTGICAFGNASPVPRRRPPSTQENGAADMRYGLQVSSDYTLFPLAINGVQRTQEGHVELVIDRRFYGSDAADAPTGRVVLSTHEALALAEELQTMSNLGTQTEEHPRRASSIPASSRRSDERPYEGPASS